MGCLTVGWPLSSNFEDTSSSILWSLAGAIRWAGNLCGLLSVVTMWCSTRSVVPSTEFLSAKTSLSLRIIFLCHSLLYNWGCESEYLLHIAIKMPIHCPHNLRSQLGLCSALLFLGCTATAAHLKWVMLGTTRGMRGSYCEPFWRGLVAPVIVISFDSCLTLIQARGVLQRNHVDGNRRVLSFASPELIRIIV